MSIIENGVHDISNEQYHSNSAISRSCLMELDKSPYHYWYKYLSGDYVSQDDKTEFVLGGAVHTLVLEPKLFDADFYITHQQKRPAKGTGAYIDMLDKACGKTVMTVSEYEAAKRIAKAVMSNEISKELIYKGARIEQSIFFTHEETGIQCKARPDIWLNGLVTDLKTTQSASLKNFQRSAFDYGYFLQAGMIHEALRSIDIKMDRFVCVAVEKKEPFPVGTFVLDDSALDYGINLFNNLMSKLKQCRDNNEWEGYGIQNLTLPAWASIDLGAA